jgi:hypothetical protein
MLERFAAQSASRILPALPTDEGRRSASAGAASAVKLSGRRREARCFAEARLSTIRRDRKLTQDVLSVAIAASSDGVHDRQF